MYLSAISSIRSLSERANARRSRLRHLVLRGDELVESGAQLDELLLDKAGGAFGRGPPQQRDHEQRGEDEDRDDGGSGHISNLCKRPTAVKARLEPQFAARFASWPTRPPLTASPSPATSPVSSVTNSCGGACTSPTRQSSFPTWRSAPASRRAPQETS